MSDLQQFKDAKYLSLETFKRDGTGIPTPVWFAESGDTFYVYTLADAWKVKRIRNNPQVRIAHCDMRGNLKGSWVEATARIVDAKEAELGQQLLDKKYGWQKKIANFFSGLRGNKHTVIAIHLD